MQDYFIKKNRTHKVMREPRSTLCVTWFPVSQVKQEVGILSYYSWFSDASVGVHVCIKVTHICTLTHLHLPSAAAHLYRAPSEKQKKKNTRSLS